MGEVDVVGVAEFAEAAEDAGGVGLGAGEETAGEGFANVLGGDDGGAIPGGADFEEIPEVAGEGLVGIGLDTRSWRTRRSTFLAAAMRCGLLAQ